MEGTTLLCECDEGGHAHWMSQVEQRGPLVLSLSQAPWDRGAIGPVPAAGAGASRAERRADEEGEFWSQERLGGTLGSCPGGRSPRREAWLTFVRLVPSRGPRGHPSPPLFP